jgi:3-oxoacyl-[acyl-carrier protein] reductase
LKVEGPTLSSKVNLDFKLSNSSVVLAGATKGVGLELAKLLTKCEAKVGIIGRTRADGKNAIEEIKSESPNAEIYFFEGDLYSDEDRSKIFESTNDIFPQGINHLVSFLGSGKTPFGTDVGINTWKEVFEKNFFSVINLVDTFLPLLKKSKENNSIIITSAIAGLERLSAPESYSCAKTALSSYVPHLSKYLSKENIRVIGISPGNIYFDGGRWDEIIKEQGDKEISEKVLSQVSMKRFGLIEELAWVYLSTISPRNSFMTGSNIIIDGQQVNKIF